MWHLVPVLITSIVEIDIGIIVSCTPNLKSVMHTHLAQVAQLFSFSYLKSRLSFHRSQRTRISSEPRTSSNGIHNVDHINTRSERDKDVFIEVRSLKNVQGHGWGLPLYHHIIQRCCLWPLYFDYKSHSLLAICLCRKEQLQCRNQAHMIYCITYTYHLRSIWRIFHLLEIFYRLWNFYTPDARAAYNLDGLNFP